MGEVVATIKLMPESPDMDVAKVKEQLKVQYQKNSNYTVLRKIQ